MFAAHKSGAWLACCLIVVAGWLMVSPHTPHIYAANLRQESLPAAEPKVNITRTVNIRSGPGTSYAVLGVAQSGEAYGVTGQNAAGSWWRIDYQGKTGWVFASLVEAENVKDVPVILVRQRQGGGGGSAGAANPGAAPATQSPSQSPKLSFDPRTVSFRLEKVFAGLNQPTFVTNAGDGSGRMFVLERAGRIKVFAQPNSDGQYFLDIEDKVDDSGPEQGLLGLAFAPDYETSGFFYVNYTDNAGDTVVARYHVSGDPNLADRESEKQLMWVDQPAPNHNGGMLTFGPDGKLWVGMGDGGGANDTFGNGQNPNTLLGKIVRLDVSGDSATSEIWATGLRNAWRFSFDPKTGDLWIGDVGQDLFEEINYVPAALVSRGGLNFGWPIMEGAHCRGDKACDTGGLQLPEFEYGHAGNGCSVTGGNVYRGQAYPQLQGVYFYADFCSGNIWTYWRGTDGAAHNERILPNAAAVASFGEDEAGELYVADYGGFIHQLVIAPP
jgi:glucose/arabinose dehydrogenase